MNECRGDRRRCYFHPRELVVGVCALCLNERLLVLVSKQSSNTSSVPTKKTIPKIFALTSFLSRSDIKHHRSHEDDHNYTSSSQEDSFISIRFENNGATSWEKDKISKMSLNRKSEMLMNDGLDKTQKIKSVVGEKGKISKMPLNRKSEMQVNDSLDKTQKIKSVVDHAKPHGARRWRKRIGHLFQVLRWKRSKPSKGNMVTKIGGAMVKYGWIRTLTKRKTKE